MAIGSSNPTINLMKLKGNDISVNAGIKDNGTQRVVISTDQTVIPISDNGGSLTVDGTVELGATSLAALETISISGTVPVSIATVPTHGVTGTFWQATQPVSLVSQPLPTGASTETTLSALNIKIPSNLTTKAAATAATTSDPSLVVSISPNNTVGVTGTVELGSASLAALENISVTVPGTVDLGTVSLTALESITVVQPTGTNMHTVVDSGTITNVQQLGGTAVSMNSGTRDAGTQRVTIATNDSVPVTGTFWQATQPVSIASVPSHAVTNVGTFPVQVSSALPAGANTIGNVNSIQSGTWTFQPGNTANTVPWLIKTYESLGTATALGALNANIVHAFNGNMGIAMVITATALPVGVVLAPYVSYDGGTNYVQTQLFNTTTGLATSNISAFTIGDSYSVEAGDGATHIKIQATSWTSGSVTVKLSATNSQGLVNLKSSALHNSVSGDYTQLVSGYASTITPTAVTSGNASKIWTTLNGAINIADGNSSITVDAPVATPAFVRLSNGASAVDTLPVSIASVPTHAVTLASTTITSIAAGDNNIGNVDIVTMPAITGTVTANIGTSGSLALNTTLTDGTQKVINRGGEKGTTVAADITSTNVDVNTQALDVSIKNTSIAVTDNGGSLTVDGSVSITGTPTVSLDSASLTALETTSIAGNVAVTGTFWQTTQPVSVASMPTTTVTGTVSVNALPAGTNAIGKLAANPNVVIGGTEYVPSVNNALTNVNTTAYAASLVAKATSGKIYNIIGYNSKAIGQFVQIHNSASLPIAGSVPVIMFYVGPMSNFSLDYGVYGKSFSTGITICNSSTGPTLTVGSADCWFTAEII